MILPVDFIKKLDIKNFNIEFINNEQYYTLRNQTMCHLFWMNLWHQILAKKLNQQHFIKYVHVDFLSPVFIKAKNLDLQVNKDIELINYITTEHNVPLPILPLSMNKIFIIYIYITIIIFIIQVFFRRLFPLNF